MKVKRMNDLWSSSKSNMISTTSYTSIQVSYSIVLYSIYKVLIEEIKEKKTDGRALVISAYPAMGKSYTTNYLTNNNFSVVVLDSDSRYFSWKYDNKGNRLSERNDNWPNNYIDYIKSHIKDSDIIFISSHEEVRKALFEEDIDYYTFIPLLVDQEMLMDRMKARGSSEEFIYTRRKNFVNDVGLSLKLYNFDDNIISCKSYIEYKYDDRTFYMNDMILSGLSQIIDLNDKSVREKIKKSVEACVSTISNTYSRLPESPYNYDDFVTSDNRNRYK
jgi:hypothetical protein